MLVKTYGSAVYGVEAITIAVEVNLNNQGKPEPVIVGLPDSAVKESMQRVESAIKDNGFFMPRTRLIVNLAPADIRKSDTTRVLKNTPHEEVSAIGRELDARRFNSKSDPRHTQRPCHRSRQRRPGCGRDRF